MHIRAFVGAAVAALCMLAIAPAAGVINVRFVLVWGPTSSKPLSGSLGL
jgi:hypothetical protein